MRLTDFEKGRIISLHQENFTQVQISKKMDVNQSTISRLLKKHDILGTTDNLESSGRSKVFLDSDIDLVKKINNKNPKSSLRETAKEFTEKTGKDMSHTTVKNILNDNNIFSFSPIKKPLLSEKNILNRFEKSKNFIALSDDEIKTIIFSDECKFPLFDPDKTSSVWRKPSTGLQKKNLTPTVKYGGGSVMVWGCFSYHGVGRLVFIDGIMDATKYVNILSNNLYASANLMGLDSFIFQQDNDPKHTSKLARHFFERKNINLLDWPAQSPDMNPIENFWSIIKRKRSKIQARNIEELKAILTEIWYSIPKETCESYALSFKKRAIKVYNAKGGHIDY